MPEKHKDKNGRIKGSVTWKILIGLLILFVINNKKITTVKKHI